MLWESRRLPSPASAIQERPLSLIRIFSSVAIFFRFSAICFSGIRRKSKHWQRERIVAGTFWVSVVAKMKITWPGGSSRVLRRALKASRGQHVDLVDDVDLVAAGGGGEFHVLAEFPDLVDPPVGGAVDLADVDRVSVRDFTAMDALVAGGRRRPLFAVDRLREDPGDRGLPDPARPAEEKGVGDALAGDRVLQRPDHMLLPQDVFKDLGSAFSGENAVFHGCSCEA